jgi:hypothetical protein
LNESHDAVVAGLKVEISKYQKTVKNKIYFYNIISNFFLDIFEDWWTEIIDWIIQNIGDINFKIN